jgi:leucyl/phenylalanyl-tRNA--protein transferase
MRLDVETLLDAYANGVFPMAGANGKIHWYSADPRGVIPLETFHIPQTLRQIIRRKTFEIRINHDFEATMRACMSARIEHTWINEELIAAYVGLHRAGHAHSLEAWRDGKLAGGLYGVSLGAAFFGESMVHRQRDASKVALVALVERLSERGYRLLDTQMCSEHLKRFGCVEIGEEAYLELLREAIGFKCRFD